MRKTRETFESSSRDTCNEVKGQYVPSRHSIEEVEVLAIVAKCREIDTELTIAREALDRAITIEREAQSHYQRISDQRQAANRELNRHVFGI